ncbi:MAG: hypothetical protein IJ552_05720 [Prevotella sp.]|nr:hypothetical protein [Prevotella sp.]
MKKLFTLMAAALFAVSASADEVTLKENVADGSTLTIAEIEAAGGADADLITIYITNKSGESRAGWGAGGFGKSSGWDTAVEFTGQEGDSWTFEYTVADIKEVAGTDDGIRFRIWSDYSIDKITLQPSITYGDAKAISFDETGFIAASEFAGLNEGAKIVITYNVAGDVTSYVGWGIGRLGSNDDTGDGPSVTVLSFSSTALGDLEATCKYSDIKKALEATPDGVKATFWGFGDGKCTASLVKVEAFDVVSDDAGEESTSMAIIYSEMKAGDFTVANATKNTDESTDTKNVYDIAANEELQFTLNAAPNVVFTITNGSDKAKAFIVNVNGDDTTDKGSVEFGGKNGVVIFKDAKVGDVIKMSVAAKGSTAGTIGVLPSTGNDLIESTVMTLPKKAKNTEGADADGYVWKEFSFTVTEDMIKTLEGVKVVRVKETAGGYRCKAASINADLPTGIQNVKAADVKSANDAIYNLAGQKVNENYKGIVIKNGKKYIQK